MDFGITQGVVALLVLAAAIIPYFLNKKKIWPFKPRLKKVLDEQKKFEGKLDDELENNKLVDYLNTSDDVVDERERLRQQIESDYKKPSDK